MLEPVAKFLIYVALASGLISSVIIDTNMLLMLAGREPAYKNTVLLDPMLGFALLFILTISIYWWFYA